MAFLFRRSINTKGREPMPKATTGLDEESYPRPLDGLVLWGDQVILPWSTVMVMVVSLRIVLANKAPITDCDEVYNYWEPLHELLYGTGFRTWEYAPQYALRTYAYLSPAYLLGRVLGLAHSPAPLVWRTLRSVLAGVTGWGEVRYAASSPSTGVALWTLWFSITSAGMYHAAPAFLPSATAMQLVLHSLAFAQAPKDDSEKNDDKDKWAVGLGLCAVLATGWPFCAVLWIPMGLSVVWKAYHTHSDSGSNGGCSSAVISLSSRVGSVVAVLRQTLRHALVIQAIVTVVDSLIYANRSSGEDQNHLFKRLVFPTLNIVRYNALGGGDELYGTEPFAYYVKNLLLNWNMALPLALGGMILYPVSLAPAWLWVLIVFPRPHKEERFLFPMYPFLASAAARATCGIASVLANERQGGSQDTDTTMIAIRKVRRFVRHAFLTSIGVGVALLSLSRSVALSVYYTAPLKVYDNVVPTASTSPSPTLTTTTTTITTVCTCGEWHRFPSSFVLADPHTRLAFLPSQFKGQLPAYHDSSVDGIILHSPKFNSVNAEETDRYVDPSLCDYIVEAVWQDCHNDPHYQMPECLAHVDNDDSHWEVADSLFFLNAEQTRFPDRVLYLPFRSHKRVHANYTLFRRNAGRLETSPTLSEL